MLDVEGAETSSRLTSYSTKIFTHFHQLLFPLLVTMLATPVSRVITDEVEYQDAVDEKAW